MLLETDKAILGKKFKQYRKGLRLTQFQLAEMIGMSEETIKNVELSRAWPSEKTLSQISEALNIDVCHLFMPISASFNVPQHFQESIKQVISMTYKNFVESALTEVINEKSDI